MAASYPRRWATLDEPRRFPECQLPAVLLPERFRGGCAFGAGSSCDVPVSPAGIRSSLWCGRGPGRCQRRARHRGRRPQPRLRFAARSGFAPPAPATRPTSISYSPAFAGTTRPSWTVTSRPGYRPPGPRSRPSGSGSRGCCRRAYDEGHRRVEAPGGAGRPKEHAAFDADLHENRAVRLLVAFTRELAERDLVAERRRVANAVVVVGPDGGAALDQADARAIRVAGLARRLFRNRGAAELEEIARACRRSPAPRPGPPARDPRRKERPG